MSVDESRTCPASGGHRQLDLDELVVTYRIRLLDEDQRSAISVIVR